MSKQKLIEIEKDYFIEGLKKNIEHKEKIINRMVYDFINMRIALVKSHENIKFVSEKNIDLADYDLLNEIKTILQKTMPC